MNNWGNRLFCFFPNESLSSWRRKRGSQIDFLGNEVGCSSQSWARAAFQGGRAGKLDAVIQLVHGQLQKKFEQSYIFGYHQSQTRISLLHNFGWAFQLCRHFSPVTWLDFNHEADSKIDGVASCLDQKLFIKSNFYAERPCSLPISKVCEAGRHSFCLLERQRRIIATYNIVKIVSDHNNVNNVSERSGQAQITSSHKMTSQKHKRKLA